MASQEALSPAPSVVAELFLRYSKRFISMDVQKYARAIRAGTGLAHPARMKTSTVHNGANYRRVRLAEVVADLGVGTAADQGAAMRCHLHVERETLAFCPDCGNPICAECSAAGGLCPGCAARVASVQVRGEPLRRRTFRDLLLLAQFLALYVLIVGIVAGVPWGVDSLGEVAQTALGWLGIAAGVLMIMARPAGWWLGLGWALAQVLEVVIAGHALNRQCLHLGGNLLVNGNGLGLNLVGVVLVILFFVVHGQFVEQEDRV